MSHKLSKKFPHNKPDDKLRARKAIHQAKYININERLKTNWNTKTTHN